MVVLGSYGAGAFAGMLAGTTSRAVVEHVACPVAVVRGSAPRIAPPRSGPVVVGVDGSAAGAAALGFGADLAAALGCRLLAVHCWSDVYATPEGGAHRSRSPEKLAAAGAAALDEQLQPIVDRHPSLDVERKLVDAPPLQALVEHAAGARMLVVGTRGRTGQTGILMGSTSLALVEFATCPVVVVHPRRAVAAGTAAASRDGGAVVNPIAAVRRRSSASWLHSSCSCWWCWPSAFRPRSPRCSPRATRCAEPADQSSETEQECLP